MDSESKSDTPETDEECVAKGGGPLCPCNYVHSDFARKLERKRNAALAVIYRIEEIYIDGCDTYEDHKAMGQIAREFLSENDPAQARRAEAGKPSGG